ncbi:hypothetical protein JTB14_018744 [Gonioctena quinquepunctata]|nr:hypothetical protein JTB14_018744 [Gonioctena quinquepunctata]
MQPNVILKQPGKAVFYLFTIMILLIVKDSYGLGYCNKPCFGPVTKVKIYNVASHGNLHIDGNNVKSNGTGEMAVYKISSGRDFYLYDIHAGKFICWNNRHRMRHKKPKVLVARKYRHKLMPYCKFTDEPVPNGYINLVPSFNKSLSMRFNASGSPINKCNKCFKQAKFLMQVVGNPRSRDPCGCPEAKVHFCKSDLRKMRELHEICNKY